MRHSAPSGRAWPTRKPHPPRLWCRLQGRGLSGGGYVSTAAGLPPAAARRPQARRRRRNERGCADPRHVHSAPASLWGDLQGPGLAHKREPKRQTRLARRKQARWSAATGCSQALCWSTRATPLRRGTCRCPRERGSLRRRHSSWRRWHCTVIETRQPGSDGASQENGGPGSPAAALDRSGAVVPQRSSPHCQCTACSILPARLAFQLTGVLALGHCFGAGRDAATVAVLPAACGLPDRCRCRPRRRGWWGFDGGTMCGRAAQMIIHAGVQARCADRCAAHAASCAAAGDGRCLGGGRRARSDHIHRTHTMQHAVRFSSSRGAFAPSLPRSVQACRARAALRQRGPVIVRAGNPLVDFFNKVGWLPAVGGRRRRRQATRSTLHPRSSTCRARCRRRLRRRGSTMRPARRPKSSV